MISSCQSTHQGGVVTTFSQPDQTSLNIEPSPSVDSRFVKCWISFGGNVGDVKATFDAALALLSLHDRIRLEQRSGLYSTLPMGIQAGRPFLNSVCGLSTELSPRALLNVLQSVENQLGRTRDIRWGPRTLDLDILSYGHHVVSEPDLFIPHPALAYRRFVLDPLVEIDPGWCHPEFSVSTSHLRTRLQARPLRVMPLDISPQQIEKLSTQLTPKFPELQLVSGACLSDDILPIRLNSASVIDEGAVIDLRRSPGDTLEQLTAALTAIFDAPERISDW
jgi:2-amino-4-hydroxy-6-hydroxymethyldihydropteridine diphosphokinase